ncbi:MAG TPA: septation protein IspZ [Allosphingosinicella sp.]|nr:septation protein IspZ [Allosphingosinicella sp.]
MTLWRYRRRFSVGGIPSEVRVAISGDGMHSCLIVGGAVLAEDATPLGGPDSIRNHRLAATLPDGREVEAEMGYVSWWTVGIAVRLDGRLVHESHKGRRIAYPERAKRMAASASPSGLPEGFDPGQVKRNRVPLLVDILLGLLFYAVAKLTDLPTAALVGAAAGIGLVVAQRFVKVDLIGGLALFGIVMLLLSAALAIAFQDDWAVKMRSTVLGLVGAASFLGDGLLGGNRLGRGLSRYLPYSDLDPARLALGMGLLGLLMAGLNYAVAALASTDVWLFYSTFVDFFLIMLLALAVFAFARGRILPRGYKPPLVKSP